MNELQNAPAKRKVLSLKKEPREDTAQGFTAPKWVFSKRAHFLVWREGGDLPARIYQPGEGNLAKRHAKALCEQTGERFHVFRSFRVYDAKGPSNG